MNFSWETTIDDVIFVINRDGISISEKHHYSDDEYEMAEEVISELNKEDFDRIIKAALWGDGMKMQAKYAQDELETILIGRGIIEKE